MANAVPRTHFLVCTSQGRARLNLKWVQGFAGIVTAVAAWSIWGSEMFPAEQEPTGGSTLTISLHIGLTKQF